MYNPGDISTSHQTSYRKVSQTLKVTRFVLRIDQLLWHLAGARPISKQCRNLDYQSRDIDTSRDLTIRRGRGWGWHVQNVIQHSWDLLIMDLHRKCDEPLFIQIQHNSLSHIHLHITNKYFCIHYTTQTSLIFHSKHPETTRNERKGYSYEFSWLYHIMTLPEGPHNADNILHDGVYDRVMCRHYSYYSVVLQAENLGHMW